jgi:Transposase IS66 family.
MLDERIYELYQSQMALLREENARQSKRIDSLLAEQSSVRESYERQMSGLKETNMEQSAKIDRLQETLDTFRATVSDQMEIIKRNQELMAEKDLQIFNLQNEVKGLRGHRFGRTAEQSALLNNRKPADDPQAKKEDYDGTPESVKDDDDHPSGAAPAASETRTCRRARRKETCKRAPKKECHVDETEYIDVDSYYKLPKGAYFMKDKDGNILYTYYTVIEHVKAKNIRKIFKVARVHMPDGSFVNTMEKPNKALESILSPTLLAMVIGWKYVYHLPANRVRKLLRDQGVHIGKSTLNRYIQNGMRLVREYMEDPFKKEVQMTDYMMVDETTELVGVEEKGKVSYRKKYLWAFFAKLKKMVFYLYDEGSRSRRVALDFLKKFSGYISTDGYTAYSIFDDAVKYPNIVHVGCWVHARRKWIDALPTDRRAMDVVNDIADLFKNEIWIKALQLKPFEVKDRREKRSGPILNRIHNKLVVMKSNLQLMANEKMKKAVDYMLNQWSSLKNFIESGLVEISNNLCEQRMKPVKLNMKNCQNIGSERAAENAAFMFSVTESCELNHINPINYLEMIFTRIRDGRPIEKELLPCYYKV